LEALRCRHRRRLIDRPETNLVCIRLENPCGHATDRFVVEGSADRAGINS
jgi:hypothetical protein